jgi:hypothetical protein
LLLFLSQCLVVGTSYVNFFNFVNLKLTWTFHPFHKLWNKEY